MKTILATGIAIVTAGLCLTSVSGADVAKPPNASCGKYGTTVEFVSTPKEAADLARRDQKLVLVLHVSGHFETPEFT